jgi:hypothetical protein
MRKKHQRSSCKHQASAPQSCQGQEKQGKAEESSQSRRPWHLDESWKRKGVVEKNQQNMN